MAELHCLPFVLDFLVFDESVAFSFPLGRFATFLPLFSFPFALVEGSCETGSDGGAGGSCVTGSDGGVGGSCVAGSYGGVGGSCETGSDGGAGGAWDGSSTLIILPSGFGSKRKN